MLPKLKLNFIIDKDRRLAILFLILTSIIWGIAPPVIKTTINYIPPLSFLMLRFWISAFMLLPVTIYILRKYRINTDRLNKITTASFLGHILALSFLFAGIELTSSSTTSIIFALSPILVTIFGAIILKEQISKYVIEGVLLAFLGTTILIFKPLFEETLSGDSFYIILGSLLVMLSVVFDGLYIIFTKKHLSHDKIINPIILITISFNLAAVVFTPLGLFEQYLNLRSEQNYYYRYCNDSDSKLQDDGTLQCDYFGCFKKTGPLKEFTIERGSIPLTLSEKYLPLGAWIGYKEIKPDTISSYPVRYECAYDKTIRPSAFTIIIYRIIGYFYPPAIYGLIYMSLLSGILAYILYQFALKTLEAGQSSLFTYLHPVFGIPVAYFLLGESISYLFILSAVLIAFGIYLAEVRSRK